MFLRLLAIPQGVTKVDYIKVATYFVCVPYMFISMCMYMHMYLRASREGEWGGRTYINWCARILKCLNHDPRFGFAICISQDSDRTLLFWPLFYGYLMHGQWNTKTYKIWVLGTPNVVINFDGVDVHRIIIDVLSLNFSERDSHPNLARSSKPISLGVCVHPARSSQVHLRARARCILVQVMCLLFLKPARK